MECQIKKGPKTLSIVEKFGNEKVEIEGEIGLLKWRERVRSDVLGMDLRGDMGPREGIDEGVDLGKEGGLGVLASPTNNRANNNVMGETMEKVTDGPISLKETTNPVTKNKFD